VIAERSDGGKKLLAKNPRAQRVDVIAAAPLTQGKLNAVRAAFKAGVTPSKITRTYLYGPAVCCKPDVSDGGIGLAHLYPARE
jgi:hypothetical protein